MFILDSVEQFIVEKLGKKMPAFRLKQVQKAFFNFDCRSFADVSVLPKDLRSQLDAEFDWLSVESRRVFESKAGDTYKAVLSAQDGQLFESVLMENRRGQWTICVSSQVGCAMGCTFCATGKMGLIRNLEAHEIFDQYRFWQMHLLDNQNIAQKRISNIVFMGMGEPMANYANVKKAINVLLEETDLGPTKITVSSVGVLTNLNRLLKDSEWPPVRIAISLHSPDEIERKKIVPTSIPGFHEQLIEWSHAYAKAFASRSHHVTYEYTLINGVNDRPEDAHALGKFIALTAISKVNVIPLNPVSGTGFERSEQSRIKKFKDIVNSYGLDCTQRKTMGDDIDAACGQLVSLEGK